jgi:hypothetical protein
MYQSDIEDENQAKVDLVVTLNRDSRQILISSHSEGPRNYWQAILANSSDNADVIFFFLREKLDVFFI